MGDAEYMIDNGLDPFMKKNSDGSLEEWDGGLNPIYREKMEFINARKNKKINKTHLIVIKKNDHDDHVYIDYIPIVNPLRKELDDLYDKCDTKNSVKSNVNEILDCNIEFREVLGEKDYCKHLHRPYQGIEDMAELSFCYDDKLTEEEKNDELEEDKAYLKKQMKIRDLPYAIEKTYESLTDDNSVLAASHRMCGWAEPRFNLTKDFSVQFLTNFGYGSVSYFYTKIRFKEIDIVPFSDWVVYSDGDLYEIIRYSTKYDLKNKYWENAMKYARDAMNLYLDDEKKFIIKYIIGECELLVNGLEYILTDECKFPYFSKFHRAYDNKYRFENRRILVKYRGEKITGALSFINSMAEYEGITSVSKFIKKIEEFNAVIQPTLIKEIDQVAIELERAEEELARIEPIYNNVKTVYMHLRKLRNRMKRIVKVRRQKTATKDCNNMSLEDLFQRKYPNYGIICTDYNKLSKEYFYVKSLIRELKGFAGCFNNYNKKITAHFFA